MLIKVLATIELRHKSAKLEKSAECLTRHVLVLKPYSLKNLAGILFWLLIRQDDLSSLMTDLVEKVGVTKPTMTGFMEIIQSKTQKC